MSIPITSYFNSLNLLTIASPRCPELPVTKTFISSIFIAVKSGLIYKERTRAGQAKCQNLIRSLDFVKEKGFKSVFFCTTLRSLFISAGSIEEDLISYFYKRLIPYK
ncbi:hypothetical protein D3C71_1750630 [compost metagenome]